MRKRLKILAEEYDKKIDVFIIAFLNSYLNPVHEEKVRKIISSMYPDKIVISSHEIDPQPKEYERFFDNSGKWNVETYAL